MNPRVHEDPRHEMFSGLLLSSQLASHRLLAAQFSFILNLIYYLNRGGEISDPHKIRGEIIYRVSQKIIRTIGLLTFIDPLKYSQGLHSIMTQCLSLSVTLARTVSQSHLLSLMSLNIEREVTFSTPCICALYTVYSFQTREDKIF
jgi:hypothetical protein